MTTTFRSRRINDTTWECILRWTVWAVTCNCFDTFLVEDFVAWCFSTRACFVKQPATAFQLVRTPLRHDFAYVFVESVRVVGEYRDCNNNIEQALVDNLCTNTFSWWQCIFVGNKIALGNVLWRVVVIESSTYLLERCRSSGSFEGLLCCERRPSYNFWRSSLWAELQAHFVPCLPKSVLVSTTYSATEKVQVNISLQLGHQHIFTSNSSFKIGMATVVNSLAMLFSRQLSAALPACPALFRSRLV